MPQLPERIVEVVKVVPVVLPVLLFLLVVQIVDAPVSRFMEALHINVALLRCITGRVPA